ncbi:MAG: tetratricopeptide repeat protein [Burkholderiaceae bacterium]|nr:tetratricopeptide repeat protein [Burkholderiaceae bacterium]
MSESSEPDPSQREFGAQLRQVQQLLAQRLEFEADAALQRLEALQTSDEDRLWCRILRLQWRSMHPIHPEMLKEAQTLVGDSTRLGEPSLRGASLRLRAALLNKCRLFELALKELGMANAVAARAGLREEEISTQIQVARVLYDAEMHEQRIRHGEQFLRDYPDAEPMHRATQLNYIGGAHKWLGRNALAIDFYRRALAEDAGESGLASMVMTNLANALVWAGELDEARQLLDQGEASQPMQGLAPDAQLWRLQAGALLRWKLGDFDAAFDYFTRAAAIGRSDPQCRVGLIAVLTRTAEAARECGRLGLALDAATELLQLTQTRAKEQMSVTGAALLEIARAAQARAEQDALQHHSQLLEQEVQARTAELSQALAHLQAEVEMRRATEAALQRAHDQLELRVQERTAELRRAMAVLVQREKLAALGSLVAGVAHELNTPIGNALLAASTLTTRTQAFQAQLGSQPLHRSELLSFVEVAQDSGQQIERALERSATLVSSFKAMAANESNQLRVEFSLREVLEQGLTVLGPSLRRQAIGLRFDCPPELRCLSHPGVLTRILSQLIENVLVHAFAAPPAEALLSVQAVDRDGWVDLTVGDNGAGIAPAIIGRIYDPFFTTRLGQGGSGLGLHLVHSLVTGTLGGEIQVHSEPDRGTVFTLRFPCISPE